VLGSCEYHNEPSSFIKGRISSSAERLSISQEGLCSVELVLRERILDQDFRAQDLQDERNDMNTCVQQLNLKTTKTYKFANDDIWKMCVINCTTPLKSFSFLTVHLHLGKSHIFKVKMEYGRGLAVTQIYRLSESDCS
jgi:hypothetical protein